MDATMILYNGKILTVDERFSIAQSVAIKDQSILAVGSNENEELSRRLHQNGRPTREDSHTRTH